MAIRRNVSVPDELAERMDRLQGVNWSGLAQRTWESQCEELEGGGPAMSRRIENLRVELGAFPQEGCVEAAADGLQDRAMSGAGDNALAFRTRRLSKIIGRSLPIKLSQGPKLVLHVVPLVPGQLDVAKWGERLNRIAPLSSGAYDFRFNADGYLVHSSDRQGTVRCYHQYFASGAVEVCDSTGFRAAGPGGILRFSMGYEIDVVTALTQVTKLFSDTGIRPPYFAMLTMIGIRGTTIAVPEHWHTKPLEIAEDDLALPAICVETLDEDPRLFMRPVFDTVWRASGLPRSFNYNENGTPNEEYLPLQSRYP